MLRGATELGMGKIEVVWGRESIYHLPYKHQWSFLLTRSHKFSQSNRKKLGGTSETLKEGTL